MGLYQGWADAPSTGAYKAHEVMEVFRQAVPMTTFLPYAKKVGISSGESVTVPIRGSQAEPTSSALDESLSIPLDKLTITSKTISMTERGRGVMVTKKAMNRSPIALLEEHRTALAEQMALDMDTVLCTGFQTAKLKWVPTGPASYNLATDGTAATAALANLNFYQIRAMRDHAFATRLMPKRENGKYTLIGATAAVRGILDDPEYLEINKGGGQGAFAGVSAGTISDVEIVEEQHKLSNTKGTNSDVGEAIFIARDALFYAVLQQPEIHYDATHDHGRFTSLAWYGDWGCGTSTDVATAGLVRLIHVTST